jgi:uncharacterized membrane protein YqaE (UPF0057 family)
MKTVQVSVGDIKKFYNLETYKDLEKKIKEEYNLCRGEYYITTRTKLINYDWNFNENPENFYQVHIKVKGGLGPLIAIIIFVLISMKSAIEFLVKLPKFVKSLLDFFKKVGKNIVKLLQFLKWLFFDLPKWLITEIFNPINLINQLVSAIFAVVRLLCLGVLDGISGFIRYFVNMVFEPIVSGFWGYVPKGDKNSKDTNPRMRSFEQPKNKVAFPVIISTVILPPMGLFMELGLKGWMNLLICCILTLFYYFPGLIYALIILYC